MHPQEHYPELGQEEKLFFQQHGPFSNVVIFEALMAVRCSIFHSKTCSLLRFSVPRCNGYTLAVPGAVWYSWNWTRFHSSWWINIPSFSECLARTSRVFACFPFIIQVYIKPVGEQTRQDESLWWRAENIQPLCLVLILFRWSFAWEEWHHFPAKLILLITTTYMNLFTVMISPAMENNFSLGGFDSECWLNFFFLNSHGVGIDQMIFLKINIFLHFLPSTLKQLLCGDEVIIKDKLTAHVWDDTSSSILHLGPLSAWTNWSPAWWHFPLNVIVEIVLCCASTYPSRFYMLKRKETWKKETGLTKFIGNGRKELLLWR